MAEKLRAVPVVKRGGSGGGVAIHAGRVAPDGAHLANDSNRAGANGMGKHGSSLVGRIGHGRIGELQRARILTAMVVLVRERGVAGVTVAHVVARSGVSRRTFYELFEDREACFLAAFEHGVAQIAERVLPAYTAGLTWRERVRAGLAALLGFIDEQPAIGGLCVVDALAGGPAVLECRARAIEILIDAVHEGRGEVGAARRVGARGGRAPRRLVAEGVVGAVMSVLHSRLSAREPEGLAKLLNPLMAMVVLPYLGVEAAERELAVRAPRARRPTGLGVAGDPLHNLDMRLTYRTVRVLLAVAELGAQESNPSSRQVADASGVIDPGQMSKLLRRLEHLGLIANIAPPSCRGKPNAWTLTTKGRQVEQAIRAQTAH